MPILTPQSALAPVASLESARRRKGAPKQAGLESNITVLSRSARCYVLDTNVLLHDPRALLRFDEHDIWLPSVVLEELDAKKKGLTDLARNAREVSRLLVALIESAGPMAPPAEGYALEDVPGSRACGKLRFFDCSGLPGVGSRPMVADEKILAVTCRLRRGGHDAVLVTNDINLRVAALMREVPAQGYRSDRAVSDADLLPTGVCYLDEAVWAKAGATSWQEGSKTHALWPLALAPNTYVVEHRGAQSPRLWRVDECKAREGQSPAAYVTGLAGTVAGSSLKPRNPEQRLAQDMLFRRELDLVSLLGVAGTGKTLLAVAAGLDQVRAGDFDSVLITRATVPMGDDIGFLPGTEQEKMNPWLGGTLRDVFSALELRDDDPVRNAVEVASMAFMRGRSFQRKFIVVDEAQNLTAHQIRTLLTRAGSGTKVVLTGNLAQIDTPYLDAGNSGLTWAVMKARDWPYAGHLILPQSERSRLAAFIERC